MTKKKTTGKSGTNKPSPAANVGDLAERCTALRKAIEAADDGETDFGLALNSLDAAGEWLNAAAKRTAGKA